MWRPGETTPDRAPEFSLLEPEALDFLATRAKQRGTTVNQLVNQLLKKDIGLIQAAAG